MSRLSKSYLYLIQHNWDYRFAVILLLSVLILKGYL